MSFMSTIKGWFSMLFGSKIKEEFNIKPIISAEVDSLIDLCGRVYSGKPDWLNPEDDIRTINFAKTICSETARLATLAVGIKVDGSARAEWLQTQVDKIYFNLRHWVEYGCAYGTLAMKYDGDNVQVYMPGSFAVTHSTAGEITGAVFFDKQKSQNRWYRRMEYHRFEDGRYIVTNKCFVSDTEGGDTKPVKIEKTPWSGLEEEAVIENVTRPLFGVLRMPNANHIDPMSPYALPIFADALEELRDLDVAYSRAATEIEDSKRTVLLDTDRMLPDGGRVNLSAAYFERRKQQLNLPKYIKAVEGNGMEPFYKEINPTIQPEARKSSINTQLNLIGYKAGFSPGYFTFDEKTEAITATQVEADDRRTLQLVKDVRDKVENCMDGLIYSLSVFADLYDLAPMGEYEIIYDFGDITYNREEDRARWFGYVTAGKVPFWVYLTKFEGYTEEEAKAMEAEAAPKMPTLFGGEE